MVNLTEIGDAMIANGLRAAGYEYVNLGGSQFCWQPHVCAPGRVLGPGSAVPTARSVLTSPCCRDAATDDGWVIGRFLNGSIIPDPKVFPHGVKATADYLHSIGMKLGIYTSRGQTTCLRRVGSQDYEKVDMQQYADWGVDCAAHEPCPPAP